MFVENSCNQKALLPLLGGKNCSLGILKGFHLFDRSVRIDPSNFSKTDLDELVQNGQSLGFLEFDQAEDNNADPTYSETVQNKRVMKIRGRKGWSLTFEKGVCFDNEMDKLNNSQSWSVVPIFEDGKAVFKKNDDGTIKGFDCRTFHETYNLPLTGDVTGTMLMIDIEETVEWQSEKGLYTPDDFNFTELEPVAGASIEIQEPLTAGSDVVADVQYLCSSSEIIGIDDTSIWNAVVNGVGVTVNSIVADETNLTFTLATPLVATDVVELEINDGVNTIVAIDTMYITGISQKITVA